ncbi:MAG: LysR family transcriptional regulator [Pseudomonadota bacterium]|nr:LysR family transcriptional regulator [Gammaproteobacteria bacterium]MBJ55278.1 LysR family transcriptional regulator [Gammaproteobacteria bacterium]MEC8861217.1 LysR family transcriptional regulator [Pseudomonadota bacterium]HBN15191.1 LysR family transcriptional regulator [Pseudohongiella sp.]
MIDIRHLKTMQALRDTGRLTDAAERLCVTQSALSHQIKELESRLGCELFLRKTRPLQLTGPGRRLLALAEQVLPMIAGAEHDIQRMVHGDAGRLYMAIECHSCFNWLMPTIEAYRSNWPAVDLDFSSGFMFDPLPALHSGELDLVITSDPRDYKSLAYLPLFQYEMQIAVAPDHALAGQAFVSPGDLTRETIITYPVERQRLDVFNAFLNPAGVEPAAVRTTELTVMMIQQVANHRGVCALPNWVLDEYVRQGLVVALPATESGHWLTLYAAVRAEQEHTAYLQSFVQSARSHCLENLRGVRAGRD